MLFLPDCLDLKTLSRWSISFDFLVYFLLKNKKMGTTPSLVSISAIAFFKSSKDLRMIIL